MQDINCNSLLVISKIACQTRDVCRIVRLILGCILKYNVIVLKFNFNSNAAFGGNCKILAEVNSAGNLCTKLTLNKTKNLLS